MLGAIVLVTETLYYKFMEIRKIYKARSFTLEQKQRLAQDMETYILTNLKFLSYTSLLHGITQHMPGYFTSESGTGNIFDLSSGSLEASNKTQRFSILCRTYRGDVHKMMSGSLVYSFLRSSIQFTKLLSNIDVSNVELQGDLSMEDDDGDQGHTEAEDGNLSSDDSRSSVDPEDIFDD